MRRWIGEGDAADGVSARTQRADDVDVERVEKRALEYANVAASICVQRMGAAPSMPTAAEVDEIMARGLTL